MNNPGKQVKVNLIIGTVDTGKLNLFVTERQA